MGLDKFRDDIEKRLEGLDREQIRRFAWLCAVRALPFLSTKRGFACWHKKDKQRYLFSIFAAIDLAARRCGSLFDIAFNTVNSFPIAVDAAVSAAYANTSYTIATDRLATSDNVDTYAAVSAYHRAAAYAADAAAHVAADAHAHATANATADAAWAAAARETFVDIIYSDLEAVRSKDLSALSNDTGIYGEIWKNFLEDLNAIGCDYWARLYENLFQSRFVIDEKELKRRLAVPDEIKSEGAAAVGQYLERLGGDVEMLNEARIIILGEKGAGKTSLARRLLDINDKLPEKYESTEGVETSIWNFEDQKGDKDINAHIWDFAGHSITHAAHRCFMSARCLYIYVYNGRIERNNDPDYWLEQIRIHGGDSQVLFLINEIDGHRPRLPEKTLQKKYPSIMGYFRVNIGDEDTTKLEAFRQTVMEMVRDKPAWNNNVVSAAAYKIKDELRESFDKTKSPHITRKQFDVIARKNGASDEHIDGILRDLHTLGLCLWYDKKEMGDFKMLVLNPDWITNGIYRIINKNSEDNKEKKHIISVADGMKMLKDDKHYEYSEDNVKYLFRLMRVYELAFFKDDDHVFIPGILSEDMADGLPEFNDRNNRLTMIFSVENVLPPNIAARVIVHRSEFGEIYDEALLWSKGAALKYREGDATALIVEDTRSITVRVKGTDKTAYLVKLRDTLKKIFDSYEKIDPTLRYEVLVPEEEKKTSLHGAIFGECVYENGMPLELPEEVIQGHLRQSRRYFDAPNEREFSLEETGRVYQIHIHQHKHYKPHITMNSLTQETDIHFENFNNPTTNVSGTGNTTAVQSQKSKQTTKVNIVTLPESVDEGQFAQILEMLEQFLASEQADELKRKDSRELQERIDEVRPLGHKTGWARMREYLNISGCLASIASFVQTNIRVIPAEVYSIFNI